MKKIVLISLAVLISNSLLLAESASDKPIFKPCKTGNEKLVDSWVDVWLTAQTGKAGEPVSGEYKDRFEILDTTQVKSGLFSVVYTVAKPAGQSAFGFGAGPLTAGWQLGADFAADFWMRAESGKPADKWMLAIYDAGGKKAVGEISEMAADGQWRKFSIPFKALNAEQGFDFSKVRAVQVEAAFAEKAKLWLDGMVFQDGSETFGVSDKTVTQYMAEAAATRPLRVDEMLSRDEPKSPIREFVGPLYRGTDLEKVNAEIIEWATKNHTGGKTVNPEDSWSLWANNKINWLLFGFGSKGRIKPGRLSPEAEKALLEYQWVRLKLKNDIASARQSPWWVTGSENHDFNMKMGNLLSSQLFMHEPDYAKRIYPDLGRMQGYAYGMSTAFRAGDAPPKAKLGSGNYKDGKKYDAEDHYKAWVSYWKEMLAERARHGFFIETNAAGYMYHTGRFLYDVYAWSEDDKLRQQARMFLDIMWAQWAQDQILQMTGGAVVRGAPGFTRMGKIAEFIMGAPDGLGDFYGFSDYQWPRQVWEMMLDRPGMGEYAYISRKPNEGQDVWPQPPGTEYTILANPNSRLVRYSWATPDYVIGTRMDHPDALYGHLSMPAEGVLFATTPDSMVQWLLGSQHQAVQDRGAALLVEKKTIRYQHPMWFPGFRPEPELIKVMFGKDIDKIEEKDGWLFVQEGNAYAAVRIVTPAIDTRQKNLVGDPLPVPVAFDEDGFGLYAPEAKPYTWEEGVPEYKGSTMKTGRTIVAKSLNSGLVVEASRKAHHETLEAFEKDILDNPLKLKQVIGEGFILTYRGCGSEARELEMNCASNQIPKIGGEYISFDCATFDSPFMQGKTGGGVVTLTGPVSGRKLVLDFNKIKRREK